MYRCVVYRRAVYRCVMYKCVVYRCVVYRCAVYKCVMYRRAVYRCAVYRCVMYRCVMYRRVVYRCVVYRCAVSVFLNQHSALVSSSRGDKLMTDRLNTKNSRSIATHATPPRGAESTHSDPLLVHNPMTAWTHECDTAVVRQPTTN